MARPGAEPGTEPGADGARAIFPVLRRHAQARPDAACITRGDDRATYADAFAIATRLADAWRDLPRARTCIMTAPGPAFLGALGACDALGLEAFLGDPAWSDSERDRIADAYRLGAVVEGPHATRRERPAPEATPPGGPSVTLFTSGTTGVPKAVQHTWASLSRTVRVRPGLADSRWFTGYPLHLFAGTQVLCQAMWSGASLHLSPSQETGDIARTIVDERVEYATGTPSFWRRLIMTEGARLRAASVRQVTLGGETVDQAILDALARVFPDGRLLHIYATSELGRVLSVGDGRAGFPASYLEVNPEPGVELRVVDGQLEVRSTNRMRRYDPLSPTQTTADDWFATGDLVEIREGRAHFVGRTTDIINVGGVKVSPLDVEAVLRTVAEVADCRVYGVSSSIAGRLVACDLVPAPGVSEDAARKAAAAACVERLSSAQRPRKFHIVPAIETTAAGKVRRSETT
jgi:acyl-coenzyme A synthetase/AMP-(fatty) acid ligase